MADTKAREVDVLVIGGGIAGLATAWTLRQRSPTLNVRLIESSGRAGGAATSMQVEGFTFDRGANGFLTNVESTLQLARDLGLGSEVVEATTASNSRYIYRGGCLHPVPMSPAAMFRSPLLRRRDVLRLFAEPLVPRRADATEESVYDFVARRFGAGVARAFAPAFVTGIVSGDASRISVGALFARLPAMEAEHGSIMGAMMVGGRRKAAARKAGQDVPSGRLCSFRSGGLGRVTDELIRQLPDTIEYNCAATSVRQNARNRRNRWEVDTTTGKFRARALVLAVPPAVAGRLLQPVDVQLSQELSAIRAADIRVIGLAWKKAPTEGHPMDGFGFLVPRGQGVRMLGSLWSSTVFPMQAPAGGAHMRLMYGGTFDPDIMAMSTDQLLELARHELQTTMGIRTAPDVVVDVPWPRTVPQYELGHLARLQRIDDRLAEAPRLLLTGNAYRGVGLNDCVADATRLAGRIVQEW